MVTARRPKRPTLAELEFQLADLRVALANANGRLDVANAERDALMNKLWKLSMAHSAVVVHCIDNKQHMFAEQQERMWKAKQALDEALALLVESGVALELASKERG